MIETVVHVKSQEQYDDLMAKLNKYKTYYITQEQLDLIENLVSCAYPLTNLVNIKLYKKLADGLKPEYEKALLRYLGGDETIEFKVKEQLYRLRRVDKDGDTVYMIINGCGTPSFSSNEYFAFTAPLEEIKKWQTPAWEIEKAD